MTMDMEGLDRFINDLERISVREFRREMSTWLEAAAFQFLEEIQREIIRAQIVDTRLLLNSFRKGSSDNVWKIKRGGLQLEVGTNLEYAKYVNDGHMTVRNKYSFIMKNGQKARWVPGRWNGSRFEYDPSSKEGMLLKAKWIEGKHYFEQAYFIFEQMFQTVMDRKFRAWLEESFGGDRA